MNSGSSPGQALNPGTRNRRAVAACPHPFFFDRDGVIYLDGFTPVALLWDGVADVDISNVAATNR
jgi:hypothetical protein